MDKGHVMTPLASNRHSQMELLAKFPCPSAPSSTLRLLAPLLLGGWQAAVDDAEPLAPRGQATIVGLGETRKAQEGVG